MIRVCVQTEEFDVGQEAARLSRVSDSVGGMSLFVGQVREQNDGLESLTLEHYPGMTEALLTELAQQAHARFNLLACTVVHRVGTLAVGAPIVFVGSAAPHRAAALQATAFLIDRLKTGAPFWKREHFKDGRMVWVEAKEADDTAAAAWD
ncbi:molybdenum cofactor biosynthesis protein MoaE [Acetobacter orientalis]|uniref:molybdenum cofactor biosynthesis protein MoaE n=1 Tax=Acetobacter orientalis TaxID=146474 RepID=UPI00209DB2EF|nr:molybdenum cofactor biosynthesis protein MoaE [Acetobacter orientalis]MCP1215512.1 molybdenum cofactor biosynthesis protein MoaE [Acetobacter orientalis]MCP1217635.1 molybdenum cofactor biosynthesis protein MoaE [Acetobacter orientalis]